MKSKPEKLQSQDKKAEPLSPGAMMRKQYQKIYREKIAEEKRKRAEENQIRRAIETIVKAKVTKELLVFMDRMMSDRCFNFDSCQKEAFAAELAEGNSGYKMASDNLDSLQPDEIDFVTEKILALAADRSARYREFVKYWNALGFSVKIIPDFTWRDEDSVSFRIYVMWS